MGFFRCSVVDGADGDALSASDALSRIHAGELDAIMIKSVYNAIECKRICDDLETNQHNLIRTDFPESFRAYFLGVNLNLAYPDLGPYFEQAVRFREGLSRLFPGELDLERRVCRFLSELDRGCEYCAAPGRIPGQSYMFTTLRAHLPGGYIPEHFDDEQAVRPSYRHLMSLIRTKLTSFVLAFSQAEAGGALEVFNVRSAADGLQVFPGGRSAPIRDLHEVEKVSFRLDPGDMIVFRSGSFLHRLTPVIGGKTRWTACSFMANSKDADRVYCWG
jgi:Carrier-protein-independent halogenase WelO5